MRRWRKAMNKEVIDLEEAAKRLKISKSRAYHVWRSWIDRGVRLLKAPGGQKPLFYWDDICRMIESEGRAGA